MSLQHQEVIVSGDVSYFQQYGKPFQEKIEYTTISPSRSITITIENNKVIDEQRLFQGLGRFRQVIEGPEGYLYFVTESPGQLFRIKPSG